jgi:hypothetical protein
MNLQNAVVPCTHMQQTLLKVIFNALRNPVTWLLSSSKLERRRIGLVDWFKQLECLPSKCEAVRSNSSNAKKEKKKNQENKTQIFKNLFKNHLTRPPN